MTRTFLAYKNCIGVILARNPFPVRKTQESSTGFKGTVVNRAFPSFHGGTLEITLYSPFKSSVILGWMTVHIALIIMNQFVVQIILVITIHAYSVNTTVFHSQALPSKIQVIYIRYLIYIFITLELFCKIKIQLKF